jgi:putative endonuclease
MVFLLGRCSQFAERANFRRPRESGDPGLLLHPMMQKRPRVYILASRRNGTLYVGVTADLARRVWEHRSNAVASFVRDYGVYRLVFAEFQETMAAAILREKRINKWRRAWKLELIERHNPQWRDLYHELAT